MTTKQSESIEFVQLTPEQISKAELFHITGRGPILCINREGRGLEDYIGKYLVWEDKTYLVKGYEGRLQFDKYLSEDIGLKLRPVDMEIDRNEISSEPSESEDTMNIKRLNNCVCKYEYVINKELFYLKKDIDSVGNISWSLLSEEGNVLAEVEVEYPPHPLSSEEVMLRHLYAEWQKKVKRFTYRVEIERLTHSNHYFEVEAESEEEAEEKALGLAYDYEWSTQGAEYMVKDIST